MTEFGEDNTQPTIDEFEQRRIDELRELERQALAEPTFDYFAGYYEGRPKQAIGEYVLANGFNVPLIQSDQEWLEAFDAGVAMARSELQQDYQGLSGLLRSTVFREDTLRYPIHFPEDVSYDWHKQLGELVKEGVRSGSLSTTEYMRLFEWPFSTQIVMSEAARYRVRPPNMDYPEASRWRHVEGTNITIFRDPSVEERYHLCLSPQFSYLASWEIGPDNYEQDISYENVGVPVPVRKMVEFYEAIRALPRFDTEQTPLLELQMDDQQDFHFLQYFKTGHRLDPAEPFDVPEDDHAIVTDDVRGATVEDGEEFKLYIAPRRLTRRMEGQGFYLGRMHPHGFGAQLMAQAGRFIVHEIYVSMKDNHWNSAPMYRPDVAIGLDHALKNKKEERRKARELVEEVHGATLWDKGIEADIYVDAKITSNGTKAVLETDWLPKYEEW